MPFEKLVEQKIREAMAEGEFDDLEGSGRPINLAEYFATPAELRAGYAVLKNAGVVPEEMQIMKEVNALKKQIESCQDEEELSRLKKRMTERMLHYSLLMERNEHR